MLHKKEQMQIKSEFDLETYTRYIEQMDIIKDNTWKLSEKISSYWAEIISSFPQPKRLSELGKECYLLSNLIKKQFITIKVCSLFFKYF